MNKPRLVSFRWALVLMLVLSASNPTSSKGQEVNWLPFEEALAAADSTGQLILVEVWAPWCGWCLKMKREVYPALEPGITDSFVFTWLNRDDNETHLRFSGQPFTPLRLAQHFGVQEVPATTILNADGNYLLHISGFVKAKKLQQVLERLANEMPTK